ncbi:MAG: hypothetical protein GKS07_10035 [Nitrosopumilus sp.]|nr:MAG: hypothetical protein GKS07_10035 [Nitrosopumilus sp.]
MKAITKIIIPVIVVLIIASLYLYIVANGYSPYYEGIGLTLYSDYKLQEYRLHSENQNFSITKITDDDLKDTSELKNLIEKSLLKEYPLNTGGRVHVTFEELDNFQHQYAKILSEKYSRNVTSFFTSDDRHMPEKYLVIDSTVHLRSFEGGVILNMKVCSTAYSPTVSTCHSWKMMIFYVLKSTKQTDRFEKKTTHGKICLTNR